MHVSGSDDAHGRVRVFTRLRPLSHGCRRIQDISVQVSQEDSTVQVLQNAEILNETDEALFQEKVFTFDGVFPAGSSQADVFEKVGLPILQESLRGFNGTILAYGQTGSGKTYSLLDDSGLLPRLIASLFENISRDAASVYKVEAAALQIYNEQADDLLHPGHQSGDGQNVTVHNGGTVPGLTWIRCQRPAELKSVFARARKNLVYAETRMNKASSRSHAVFQLRISRCGSEPGSNGLCACLNIVDLAGSERVKKSGVEGIRFKEAAAINKSLLALGNVVSALAAKKPHVPFRDSKLTLLLSDAIGGNCKTALLACASQATEHVHESVSTLDFASRAMHIEVQARVNTLGPAAAPVSPEEQAGLLVSPEEEAAAAEVALADALEKVEQAEAKAAALELEAARCRQHAETVEAGLEAERRSCAERAATSEADRARERQRAAEAIARLKRQADQSLEQSKALETEMKHKEEQLSECLASLKETALRIQDLEAAAKRQKLEKDDLSEQLKLAQRETEGACVASSDTFNAAEALEAQALEKLRVVEVREAEVAKQAAAISQERAQLQREFETKTMLQKEHLRAKSQAQQEAVRVRVAEAERRGEAELERRLALVQNQEEDAECIAKQKNIIESLAKTIEDLRRELRQLQCTPSRIPSVSSSSSSSETTLRPDRSKSSGDLRIAASTVQTTLAAVPSLPLPEKRPHAGDCQLSAERSAGGRGAKRRGVPLPIISMAERSIASSRSSSTDSRRSLPVGKILAEPCGLQTNRSRSSSSIPTCRSR